MQRLKLLVGIISALIVVAMCLVVYGMSREARKLALPKDTAPIALEAGEKVIHIGQYQEYLTLLVAGAAGKQRIVFVDPYRTTVIHTLPIESK